MSKKNRCKKADCKYHDTGYCVKFRTRCFDCKEYKRNKSYVRKEKGENWASIV